MAREVAREALNDLVPPHLPPTLISTMIPGASLAQTSLLFFPLNTPVPFMDFAPVVSSAWNTVPSTLHSWLLFFSFFLATPRGSRRLVPRPGIEPGPPAVEAWSLNHWTSREVPAGFFYHSGLNSNVTSSERSFLMTLAREVSLLHHHSSTIHPRLFSITIITFRNDHI